MNPENPYQAPKVKPTYPPQKPTGSGSLASILFSFEGHIPRRVYWGASLVLVVVFYGVVVGLMLVFGEDSAIALIAMLVMYVPVIWISLAVQCKRWHDVDKSGWWILINFVPCIGGLWAFVENGCLRGTVGPNQYGPDPT